MNQLDQYQRRGFGAAFLAALGCLIFAANVFFANAFAAALVQELRGDVRAGTRTGDPAPVEKGQRLLTGAMVTTGPNSQATLAFDDGQQVVVSENSQFWITDYQFQQADRNSDRSILSLLRGAARTVTGQLAQRSREMFEFRMPTSTIGIRGTDFIVALVDEPSYLSVLQGEIAATNTAGTVTFGAGSFGMISSATALAVAISAAALPAAAASAFSNLGAAAVGAGASAGATAAAGLPVAAVVGGVVATAAAVISGNNSGGGNSTTPASTQPPAGAVCNAQQIAGGDAPDSKTIDLGKSAGTFVFSYDTAAIPDQIMVIYEGNTLFDTGCVGASGNKSINFSGKSTQVNVKVTPNCANPGGTGTFWTYTVGCP